jgi:unsaturated rhamnogalacturonyl hydrolase
MPVAAWALASTTGGPDFADHAQRIVDHISSGAPRVDGVMRTHAGRPQLWVDSMFFSLPALYRASRETGTTRYRDDADAQFLGYLEHLMDPATSFFIHCWDQGFQAPARYAVGSFEPLEEAPAWARGNAWALLALMEGIANSQSKQFRPAARQLAARVAEVQTDSGGWHTVLDRPDTYVETSASAMFALAFLQGVQLGVLSADYARLAELTWNWLQGYITLNRLTGVSAGTPPGNVLDYQRVSVGSETFGDGFLILLGLELTRIG